MTDALLDVAGLHVSLRVASRVRPILRGVDLSLAPGEFVGIVGESGSGKSVTARTIMRLLPPDALVHGTVRFQGADVLAMAPAELRRCRARGIAMVFQDPRASINPVVRCGSQLMEVLRMNLGMSRNDAETQAVHLLELMSIREPHRVMRAYPLELSGGMLQRVMIAMALAGEPALIIADEATTSLDVTVQADILAILHGLRAERDIGLVFITHDLELAAAMCDRIVVMYAGAVVEEQPTASLFADPRHPYTAALLASRPDVTARRVRLPVIPGRPAALEDVHGGCAFEPRCPIAVSRCVVETPKRHPVDPRGFALCHRADERGEGLPPRPERRAS